MPSNARTKNGHRRRQLREWWRAQELPCHLCGQPIDYTLPARDPMSFEVDEIIPVSLGGDPLSRENTAPAHRICNQKKGARLISSIGAATGTPIRTSRQW